jgi:hypothetical protein
MEAAWEGTILGEIKAGSRRSVCEAAGKIAITVALSTFGYKPLLGVAPALPTGTRRQCRFYNAHV